MTEQQDMLILGVALSKQKIQHILDLFKKPSYRNAIEDLSEWIANLQICDKIFERIIEAKLENNSPPSILQSVISTLNLYEHKLQTLEKQGRIVRFFMSPRLRKQLDHLNSFLCRQVAELESEIKAKVNIPFKSSIKYLSYDSFLDASGSSQSNSPLSSSSSYPSPSTPRQQPLNNKSQPNANVSEEKFVQQVEQIWTNLFGKETFVVSWNEFISKFKTQTPVNPTEENVLKDIIDHSNTGNVNNYKFVEFLKGFGPLESCVHTAVKIYHEGWFHGFMSREESKRFLETEPYGTYLVRFSSTKPGSFAITYVGFQIYDKEDSSYQVIPSQIELTTASKATLSVHNILVSAIGNGFRVKESSSPNRTFQSLKDILQFYSTILKIPFTSDLPEKSWFHGDLEAAEAQELLEGKPIGTFLVRFSSKPGCFATSFVGPQGKVQKALLNKDGNGYRIENSQNNKLYLSIQEFVKDYMSSGIFKTPFRPTDVSTQLQKHFQQQQRSGSSITAKNVHRTVPSLFLDDLPCVLDNK